MPRAGGKRGRPGTQLPAVSARGPGAAQLLLPLSGTSLPWGCHRGCWRARLCHALLGGVVTLVALVAMVAVVAGVAVVTVMSVVAVAVVLVVGVCIGGHGGGGATAMAVVAIVTAVAVVVAAVAVVALAVVALAVSAVRGADPSPAPRCGSEPQNEPGRRRVPTLAPPGGAHGRAGPRGPPAPLGTSRPAPDL